MNVADMINVTETLRFEHLGDGVGVLYVWRPEHRNAWTLRLARDLHEALTALDDAAEIRVLIVSGAGDVFSVGADLDAGSILQPGDEVVDLPARSMLPSGMRMPVIAALNGHAVGAGISFAMHCDLRILADDGKIAFAFIKRGVIPEMGMHWLLPRVVGLGVATDLLLTGRTLTSDDALRLGLVHQLRPAEQVLNDAVELARELVRTTSPLGSSYTKRLMWDALGQSWEVAHREEMGAFERCAGHPDAVEGVASFLERRDPQWTGHIAPKGPTPT